MAETSEALRGRLLWVELLARDPAAARAFYPPLLGWTTSEIAGLQPPYTVFHCAGRALGGLLPLPEGAESTSSWLPHFGVEDVDAAAIRAEEEGGAIHRAPADIAGVGRFAVLADPFGAAFAVDLPAGGPRREDGPPRLGEVSWLELAATEIERAVDFYGELFAWRAGRRPASAADGFRLDWECQGRGFGGVHGAGGEAAGWLVHFRVASLDAARARARQGGADVEGGARALPGGERAATVVDPQGARFALHEACPA